MGLVGLNQSIRLSDNDVICFCSPLLRAYRFSLTENNKVSENEKENDKVGENEKENDKVGENEKENDKVGENASQNSNVSSASQNSDGKRRRIPKKMFDL